MIEQRIVYGNTILKNLGKKGILKPDTDGYYTVVLGALGVDNSAGEHYINSEVSRSTFAEGSTLHNRLGKGLLRGEWGHPKPQLYPNMRAFERRVRMIDEDRISHHIRSVWLEEVTVDGQRLLCILGEVCPSGPYGDALKKALDNPDENVTFSGRYYSNLTTRGGQTVREIHTCGTWDFVSEPGIDSAHKYNSPSLESSEDIYLTQRDIMAAAETEEQHQSMAVSMESGGLSAKNLMSDFNIGSKSKGLDRAVMKW